MIHVRYNSYFELWLFKLNQRTKMQGFPGGILNFLVSYGLVCDDPKGIFWN